MTTRSSTCSTLVGAQNERCDGTIRPSYLEVATGAGAIVQKDVLHPAACERCGATFPDTVTFAMSVAELEQVGNRLSPSTRQELQAVATELRPGTYSVQLDEDRARDLSAKAANLSLVDLAAKVRVELSALSLQRRRPD